MRLIRHLQHWLGGSGPCIQVANAVPTTHSIRPWADTFPWAELVAAVDQSFARRFPRHSNRGRRPVSTRVLLALELLKHEVGASDEAICERLRTDVAVMYVCGLETVQLDNPQAHFVLPATLAQFRSRIDEALMDELVAIQAAAAIDEGLVSPAHLLVDTFPSEQGSQRVTDATTLDKAQKNPPTRRTHHTAMHSPRHDVEEPSPRPPAGAAKGHAMLRPAVPRSGQSLREAGAPNRNAAVGPGHAH